jgi:hypothetical protein
MPILETSNFTDVENLRAMVKRGQSVFSQRPEAIPTGTSIPRDQLQSRYLSHRILILRWKDRFVRTIETWERPRIPPVYSRKEKFFVVSRAYSARPDKVAITNLGNKLYWWWVLFLNGLQEPEEIEAGVTLRITRPPQEDPFLQQLTREVFGDTSAIR